METCGKMLGVLFGAMSYIIVDKIIIALKMVLD